MSDERTEAQLAAYIDGRLPPEELAAIRQQLAQNPRQARMVSQMVQARQWLAALPRVQAPPDLLDSIDPMLERSALIGDEAIAERRERPAWLSPQVLALAATVMLVLTLVVAMVLIVPGDEGTMATDDGAGGAAIDQPPTPDGPGPSVATQPTLAQRDPVRPDNQADRQPGHRDTAEDAIANRDTSERPDADGERRGERRRPGEGQATPPDGGRPTVADAGPRPGTGIDLSRLPRVPENALLLAADVPDALEASGEIATYLAGAALKIDGNVAVVSVLPPPVREMLNLPAEQRVMVYVMEDVSLAQVGELTSRLSALGEARVQTPKWDRFRPPEPIERFGLVAPVRPDAPQLKPEEREALRLQGHRIYAGDRLNVLVTRKDEPPAETPRGMPELAGSKMFEVTVTPDGYAELGGMGLGRFNALGVLPADLERHVKHELWEKFQIPVDVSAVFSKRTNPPEGRTDRTLQLMYLDREPLKPGDLLHIEYADGSWLQANVNEQGLIRAGDLGEVQAAGLSAVALQTELQNLHAQKHPPEAPAEAQPTTQPKPALRLVNLTARRAAGADSRAETKVPVVVVLTGAGLESREVPQPRDPWAPLTEPDPATRPSTQPTTRPAGGSSTTRPAGASARP